MVKRSKYSELNSQGASQKTYSAWRDMNRRCYDEHNEKYPHYGARGIKVCKRWHRDNPKGYVNFFTDLGIPPEGYSIDRINVNGNYSPSNVRWANKNTQSRNRRKFAALGSFTPEEIAAHLRNQNDNYLLEVFKHLKRKR